MKISAYITAILTAVFFGAMGSASAEEVIEKLSTRQLENILETLVDAEIISDVEELDAADTYTFKTGNMTVLLINNHDDLQIHFAFSTDKSISLSKINEWNRNSLRTRAYLDDDRDPVLEADLFIQGGVSEKRIGMWIGLFCVDVNEYVKMLEEE